MDKDVLYDALLLVCKKHSLCLSLNSLENYFKYHVFTFANSSRYNEIL
jgi:hypothetical protein